MGLVVVYLYVLLSEPGVHIKTNFHCSQSKVTINYTATLDDGTVFDKQDGFVFTADEGGSFLSRSIYFGSAFIAPLRING
jgi:hypothetical protein